MQITRMIIPQNKWNLKCPYQMDPEYITVHNTDNDASAMAEVSYMIGNNNSTSFHTAVDDARVVQGIEFNRNAFHSGDGRNGPGNRKSIGIEICYSLSGGPRFVAAEKLAAEYIAHLLKERNWGIDRVRKHQDWSSKYCPRRTLDMGWQRFLNMIQDELKALNKQSLKLEDIYDEDLYESKYSEELKGHNLWNHLNSYGIKEGRVFSYIFDAKYYGNKYKDLKNAYGNDYQGLFNHFITYGFFEGRAGSPIYEGNFYKKHTDLSNRNVNDLLAHFLAYGMNEGRQANEDFNPIIYKELNKDLRKEFGNNMKEYYRHYLVFGINEKRVSC